VAIGAFGAHGLKERLASSGHTEIFETAARYHMYHALALVMVGLLAFQANSTWLNLAGACFTAGILIFSGLLYTRALDGPKTLGAIVPVGGLAFIIGWLALGIAAASLARK
jgi:uncharacterized membrane protein YgdD (TMEM256/DUF423 family)